MAGTRASRLTFVFVSTLAILALMMIGIDPQVQHSVDEIMSEPEKHSSDSVFVRGIVVNETIDFSTMPFTLGGSESTIGVDFANTAVPDGFDSGRTVAVRGHLIQSSWGWTISATEIQTGCPSKYES